MSRAKKQIPLFDLPEPWRDEWEGMPDFSQLDLRPFQTVKVHFKNQQDREEFATLIGQTVTDATRGLWFPRDRKGKLTRSFVSASNAAPRYPVYVVSKGRWDSRLTVKALEQMQTPFRIVVEPQEVNDYAAVIDPAKILALPFSNLGQGSIPARNWIWEHAINDGHARHWIIDDNISSFNRLQDNVKWPVHCSDMFCAAEDFVDRYENVALAGFDYHGFTPAIDPSPPFRLNTRIYSCILIDNALPHRWRGKYNEDTDLSLRVLKDGLCTVLFMCFLIHKNQTMTMRGGNTDELYKGDGRLEMAESLREQHPDVVRIVEKWGRWQHSVNYRPFRNNKLLPKANGTANGAAYDMELA